MKEALGLVETRGISTAILVADTMAKAANIRIIEMENTKGSGYMTVKIAGDVGAVTAAVDAGKKTAILHDKLVSCKVIPRPSDSIAKVFCGEGAKKVETPKAKEEPEKKEAPKAEETTKAKEEPKAEETTKTKEEPKVKETTKVQEEPKAKEAPAVKETPTAKIEAKEEPKRIQENKPEEKTETTNNKPKPPTSSKGKTGPKKK